MAEMTEISTKKRTIRRPDLRMSFPSKGLWENDAAYGAEPPLTLGRTSLQRKRMQFAAHLLFERLIDDLMLLDTGFAPESLGDDCRRVMVAVAGKIADRHFGIRYSHPNQSFDVVRSHGHWADLLAGLRFTARPNYQNTVARQV
jgi:hypothetical protein